MTRTARLTSRALRKAAILVSSLEGAAASALLEQMGPEQADAVRAAISELGDVSEAEEQRIVEEFLAGQSGSRSVDDGVELAPSLTRRLSQEKSHYDDDRSASARSQSARSGAARSIDSASLEEPKTAGRFSFLRNRTPSAIAGVLVRERPQTTAVVLYHLSPAQAADVLGRLPEDLQTEVFERLATLAEPDPDFVAEVECQLERLLGSRPPGDVFASAAHPPAEAADPHVELATAAVGRPVAEAILRNIPDRVRSGILKRISAQRPELASELLRDGNAAPHEHQANPQAGQLDPLLHPSSSRSTASDNGRPQVDQESGSIGFDDLAALDNRSWLRILGASDPQVAVLALAGAENGLVERILKSLPRRERKRLRQEMNSVAPLPLRDVTRAQARVARAAAELALQGAIDLQDSSARRAA